MLVPVVNGVEAARSLRELSSGCCLLSLRQIRQQADFSACLPPLPEPILSQAFNGLLTVCHPAFKAIGCKKPGLSDKQPLHRPGRMGMRSLSKKLKSLEASVQTTQESTAGKSAPTAVLHDLSALQARLNGQWWGHSEGQVLYAEEIFPVSMTYGRSKIHLSTSLQQLSRWLGLETLATTPLEQMLFLDTETTGLAGGAGTYAFMVGLGWFTEAGFCLRQFFLRDPSEESEFLQVLAEQFVNKTLLVTFNGKSYDVPLLRNRFALKKQPFSLDSLDHLDLLTLARRLWSNRLPSRRLRALESEILGVERSEEDIEGHLIPDVYFGFLKNGEVGQLPQVFHHNKMDIEPMMAMASTTVGSA